MATADMKMAICTCTKHLGHVHGDLRFPCAWEGTLTNLEVSVKGRSNEPVPGPQNCQNPAAVESLALKDRAS